MARKPSVNYWQRKGGGYFATIQGTQVELALGPDDFPSGPTYLAAVKKFGSLMSSTGPITEYTLSDILERYKEHLGRRAERKEQLRQFLAYTREFDRLHGSLKVSVLRAYHVTGWLDAQTSWGDTTKSHAVLGLQMALNHGVRQGHIEANPILGKVDGPEARVRGREARMSSVLCDLLCGASKRPSVSLMTRCLRATGARPVELFRAKVKNLRGNMIVHPWNAGVGEYRHKTARTRKDRIICLPPELADEVREAASGRPGDSPLFVGPRGKVWKQTAYQYHWDLMRRTDAVAGHLRAGGISPDSIIPYNFRHTFISEWLDSGRSIQVCARLVGTSVSMIESVYGHPDSDKLYDMFVAYHEGR